MWKNLAGLAIVQYMGRALTPRLKNFTPKSILWRFAHYEAEAPE